MPDHLSAFDRTFRQAHALSRQLLDSEFRRKDPAIAALLQYVLRKQRASDYPFVFTYSFCRKESDARRVRRMAAAVHLLQSSTFISDDIFDRARLRCGQPAVHVRYGVNDAILAGLLTQGVAMKVIGEELERGHFRNRSAALRCFHQIVLDLYQCQYLDLHSTGNLRMAQREYERIIALGSGHHFAYLAKCGALLAGKRPQEVERLRRYGYHYGMALFLTDDIRDVRPAAVTGKEFAADLKNRRMRLPMILALHMASPRDAAFLRRFYRSSRASAAELRRAARILRRSGALATCRRAAERHISLALRTLRGLRRTTPAERLYWLAAALMLAQGLEQG